MLFYNIFKCAAIFGVLWRDITDNNEANTEGSILVWWQNSRYAIKLYVYKLLNIIQVAMKVVFKVMCIFFLVVDEIILSIDLI